MIKWTGFEYPYITGYTTIRYILVKFGNNGRDELKWVRWVKVGKMVNDW